MYSCPDCDYRSPRKFNYDRHLTSCPIAKLRRQWEEREATGAGAQPPLPVQQQPENTYRGPDDYTVQRIVDRPTLSVDRLIPQNPISDYTLFLIDVADTATYIVEQERKRFTAVKFELSLKVEFYSAKNPDVDQSFVFRQDAETTTSSTNVYEQVVEMCNRIEKQIDEYTENESGWVIQRLVYCDVHVYKFKPSRALSYFPLPKIIRYKRAIINVKNRDNKCFMWSILVGLYLKEHPKASGHLEIISRYKRMVEMLNFTDITFPVKLTDVERFERQNNIPVNVYGLEKEFHILHLTQQRNDISRIINLLLITKGTKQHYCCIKDLNMLMHCQNKSKSRKFVCPFCLFPYTTEPLLQKHLSYCKTIKIQQQQMPTYSTVQFRNVKNQMWLPLTIVADFECFLKPTNAVLPSADNTKSFTLKTQTHVPNSFASLAITHCGCSDNTIYDTFQLSRGPGAVDEFLEETLERGKQYQLVRDIDRRMDKKKFPWGPFNAATHCHICSKQFDHSPCYFGCKCDVCLTERRVRDHCHWCGTYRGPAHSRCNFEYRKQRDVAVIFHNLRRYDSHFIMQYIAPFANRHKLKIDCIPKGAEDYLTFSLYIPHKLPAPSKKTIHWKLRFIDSFQFLSTSLESLVKNLLGRNGTGASKFGAMHQYFPNDRLRQLLLRKGIYPYDLADDWNVFELTSLPPREAFFNKLTDEEVPLSDYEHAQKVWHVAGCTNFGDYHDLYLKTDVLLLSDIFHNFRKTCMNSSGYGLDPSHYISLPSYAWDVALKMTGVKLELLEDPDSYRFFESGIRGGVSVISKRHGRANNPLMGDEYDNQSETSYLMYFDVNNLYGWSMSQHLPVGGFRWLEQEEISHLLNNFEQLTCSDAEGYILEVDFEIPAELHDKLNDYPPAPEHLEITNEMLSPTSRSMIPRKGDQPRIRKPPTKLCPNLLPKKNYIVHYLNLQYYLKMGVVISKAHRVMAFHQAPWLKVFIDFNTECRKHAESDFEKDFFKLANNATFGKSMEDKSKWVDIRLVTTEKDLAKLISSPLFKSATFFDNELIAVSMIRDKVVLNKPIFTGFSILELSKLVMYRFHYEFVCEKYGSRAQLLFTDTDSLSYLIRTDNIYHDMANHLELFDTSDYPTTHPLWTDKNKKVIGVMKDELNGALLVEFVGLRSKMYSMIGLNSQTITKRAKGVKKSVVKNKISHQDYYNVLMDHATMRHTMMRFQTNRHVVHTVQQQKVSLTCFEDKRFLLPPNGINTLAYGHYQCSNYQ